MCQAPKSISPTAFPSSSPTVNCSLARAGSRTLGDCLCACTSGPGLVAPGVASPRHPKPQIAFDIPLGLRGAFVRIHSGLVATAPRAPECRRFVREVLVATPPDTRLLIIGDTSALPLDERHLPLLAVAAAVHAPGILAAVTAADPAEAWSFLDAEPVEGESLRPFLESLLLVEARYPRPQAVVAVAE